MKFRVATAGLWALVVLHIVMLSTFWSQESSQHIRYVWHEATYSVKDGHPQPNPRTGSYDNYSNLVYVVHFFWMATWICLSFITRLFDREQTRGAFTHCCNYWGGLWLLPTLCALVAWSITIVVVVYDRDTIGWFQSSAPLALMIEVIFAVSNLMAGFVVAVSLAFYFFDGCFDGCFTINRDDKPQQELAAV